VLDLVTHGLEDFVAAVGDPFLGSQLDETRRTAGAVAVTARDADRMARGTTRGPMMSPRSIACMRATSVNPDEPTSRTVVKPLISVSRALRTPSSASSAASSRRRGFPTLRHVGGQVSVRVDEPRQQRETGQLDDLGTGRRGRRIDSLDALSPDDDDGRRHDPPDSTST
jgi:hypothetical protein